MWCPHPQKHGFIIQMIPALPQKHHTFKHTQPLPPIKYYGRNTGALPAKNS